MRFTLRFSALNAEEDGVAEKIDQLVDRFGDEVHLVEIPEADLLSSSRWYQGARRTRRKLLEKAVSQPVRRAHGRGPHAKHFEADDPASVQRAYELAYTPLTILVEDPESDGALLHLFVEEVGWPTLQNLWERNTWVRPEVFKIENAGGIGSMPTRIQRALSNAKDRPLRYWVLCDSDARWPGDFGKNPKQLENVRKICAEEGIPCRVLRKRVAESYVPDDVLEEARSSLSSERRRRLDALLRRSPVQRDHFPVVKGLKAGERALAAKEGLYDEASEGHDLKLLEGRIFPKSPRVIVHLLNEHRKHFTREGLMRRDGQGEIEEILKAIAEEI